MRSNKINKEFNMRAPLRFAAALALAAVLAPAPDADGLRPGSVLVYPYHRSSVPQGPGIFTVISVTNTSLTPAVPGSLGGSTNLHYEYVNTSSSLNGTEPDPFDPDVCSVFDRVETLTPADVLSLLTSCHNATAGAEGYLVISATDPETFASPWSHNRLIGSELILGQLGVVYYINAIPFSSPLDEGMLTDLDGDGQLDFDGLEYEGVPDEIYIDAFTSEIRSSLVLLNLSGGFEFTANVAFDVFNDNELPLSATLAFRCWFEETLETVSPVFTSEFLKSNMLDDPTDLDINCDNNDDLETGWAIIRGVSATSEVESIPDPALLGAISNSIIFPGGGRRLWESTEKQFNGDFFNTGADDPEFPPPAPEENEAPTGVIETPFTPGVDGAINPQVGQSVKFMGGDSSDPEGSDLVYFWDFGDGSSAMGAKVWHKFNVATPTKVTLTVSDEEGLSGNATMQVVPLP